MKLRDTRATDKIREVGITYSQLTQRLRIKGYDFIPVEVYDIVSKRKKATKKLQEDIADILGCLRKDIF